MQIAVVGTGYVGLVTGTCLAEVGHNVICVDIDENKVRSLRAGQCPIYEPGLEELIGQNVAHERLSFTCVLAEALRQADVAFIAVGTPEGEDGSADLTYVRAVARAIAENANRDMTVVVKSTVPVGTCDDVEAIITKELNKRGSSLKLSVASNPEFLKEGAAVADFMHPDRIIVGITRPEDEAVFMELYSVFVIDDPAKLFIVDRRSSELIKYSSNAMLAVRISFMNEVSRLCEKVKADVDAVRRGMGADPRIGRKFLWAGPGYGGSCFPKDVAALIKSGESYGVPLTILEATQSANEEQKKFVANKIVNHFKGDLNGKTIAVWGLAFKPGTDDVREAPALTIIEMLLKKGAKIQAHDPQGVKNFSKELGEKSGIRYDHEDAYSVLKDADALVIVTEWPEYKRPNWSSIAERMRGRVLFDLRNQWTKDHIKKAGFTYFAVGRPDDLY
jgi:UDPglucose 6-dehydrogenase